MVISTQIEIRNGFISLVRSIKRVVEQSFVIVITNISKQFEFTPYYFSNKRNSTGFQKSFIILKFISTWTFYIANSCVLHLTHTKSGVSKSILANIDIS